MTSSKPAPARPGAASPRAEARQKGRQADSARRRQRVIAALNKAAADGAEISISGIARAAAVDRTFLYRHRDLLGKIHALEATPPAAGGGAGPAVTRASLQADLLAAHERAIRLTARVQQLEHLGFPSQRGEILLEGGSPMGETRRKFDRDFREGAVRLVRETGKPIAQVARDLGMNAGTLGNWVDADRRRREGGDGQLGEGERAELARLRKENAELAMRCDVLKRSVALWVSDAMGSR